MVGVWLSALLLPVLAKVATTQSELSLTLTDLETATIDLDDYFHGDALSFQVDPTPGAFIELTNPADVSFFSVPVQSSPKPSASQVWPNYFFFGAVYFVTYTNSTLNIYQEHLHIWNLQWTYQFPGPIDSVVLIAHKEYEVFLFVATMNATDPLIWTFLCADLDRAPKVYSGFELSGLTNVQLRSSSTFNGLTLALKGTRASEDEILLYEFMPDDCVILLCGRVDRYQSGASLSVLDFQLACYLVVLDTHIGLVSFTYSDANLTETLLGAIPGAQGLALSNIDVTPSDDYFVLWTSAGAFLGPATNLPLLAYFPLPAGLDPTSVTMYFEDNKLVLLGTGSLGPRLFLVYFQKNGLAYAQVAEDIDTNSTLAFACWLEQSSLKMVQVLESSLSLVEVQLYSPQLKLTNVKESLSLLVTADSGLGGSAQLTINTTAIELTDNHIYYGEGFDLSEQDPGPAVFEQSFTDEFATFNISLDSLFSGPELQFSLKNYSFNPPVSPEIVVQVTQHLSPVTNASNQFSPSGAPILGCTVAGSPMSLIMFTGKFVVFGRYDDYEDLSQSDMRSYEIDEVPKLCVANSNFTWVYAEDKNVTIVHTFSLQLEPLAMFPVMHTSTPEACQALKLTTRYLMCVGRDSVVLFRFLDSALGVISANQVPRSLKPWNITDAEFLSSDGDIVALADTTNGLNQLDVSQAFQNLTPIAYGTQLLPAKEAGSQLRYSSGKLIVINGIYHYSVYTYTGNNLEFLMALPPRRAEVSEVVLLQNLLFVTQGLELAVYNIATTVHNSLYAVIAFEPFSKFLLFPLGVQINLMVVTLMDVHQYRTQLYEVALPSEPASFSCLLWCSNCLLQYPQADLVLTVSVVALNSLGGSASRDLVVTFRNQGTFPAYYGTLPAFYPLFANNSTELELWEVFEGNQLSFSLSINNLTNWQSRPAPLTLTQAHTSYQVQSNGTQCPLLNVPATSRLFFVCYSLLYVYEACNQTLKWEAEVDLTFLQAEASAWTGLQADEQSDVLVLELPANGSLVVLVYNHLTSNITSWASVSLPQPCLSVAASALSEGSFRLICSSSLQDSDPSVGNMLTVIGFTYVQDSITQLELLNLLSPLNLAYETLRPYDMDISSLLNGTTWALFLLDKENGVSMIAAEDSYEVLTQISKASLAALVGPEAVLNLRVCDNRLLVVCTSHILVYLISANGLEWEQTIYPYNEGATTTYYADTALCYKGKGARFLAVMAYNNAFNSSDFVRIVDFIASGKSHIVTEFSGYITYEFAAFASPHSLVLGFLYESANITLHQLAPPSLQLPTLSPQSFNSLYQSWGTTNFVLQLSASNTQGNAISPKVTLRRLLHNRLERYGREDIVSPWLLVLYLLFLLLLGVLGVFLLRRQAKQQGAMEESAEEMELRPING